MPTPRSVWNGRRANVAGVVAHRVGRYGRRVGCRPAGAATTPCCPGAVRCARMLLRAPGGRPARRRLGPPSCDRAGRRARRAGAACGADGRAVHGWRPSPCDSDDRCRPRPSLAGQVGSPYVGLVSLLPSDTMGRGDRCGAPWLLCFRGAAQIGTLARDATCTPRNRSTSGSRSSPAVAQDGCCSLGPCSHLLPAVAHWPGDSSTA
jgi:hypothetical protein